MPTLLPKFSMRRLKTDRMVIFALIIVMLYLLYLRGSSRGESTIVTVAPSRRKNVKRTSSIPKSTEEVPVTVREHSSSSRQPSEDDEQNSPIHQEEHHQQQQCVPTWHIDAQLLQLMKKSVPASGGTYCLRAIEPINPVLPIRDVENTCTENRRRWLTIQEHMKHIDWMEIERRKSRARKLFQNCPPISHVRHYVYFDLGSRDFHESVKWFLSNYPVSNTFLIHAYEYRKVFERTGYSDYPNVWFHNVLPWNETGYATMILDRPMPLYDQEADQNEAPGAMQARHLHQLLEDRPHTTLFHKTRQIRDPAGLTRNVGKKRLLTVPTKAVSEVLLHEVRPEDFVVMRMDVNGNEWLLIHHLIETGTLHRVDELFLVCHNIEISPLWPEDVTTENCQSLIATLREGGIYVHEWW